MFLGPDAAAAHVRTCLGSVLGGCSEAVVCRSEDVDVPMVARPKVSATRREQIFLFDFVPAPF